LKQSWIKCLYSAGGLKLRIQELFHVLTSQIFCQIRLKYKLNFCVAGAFFDFLSVKILKLYLLKGCWKKNPDFWHLLWWDCFSGYKHSRRLKQLLWNYYSWFSSFLIQPRIIQRKIDDTHCKCYIHGIYFSLNTEGQQGPWLEYYWIRNNKFQL